MFHKLILNALVNISTVQIDTLTLNRFHFLFNMEDQMNYVDGRTMNYVDE